jgi:DNA-binding response OmpR family regulator
VRVRRRGNSPTIELLVVPGEERFERILRELGRGAKGRSMTLAQLEDALAAPMQSSALLLVTSASAVGAGSQSTAKSVLLSPAPAAELTLDCDARVVVELSMPALASGELRLLRYLGARPGHWFSSFQLALSVFQRSDAAARQLIWKYASTLRRKLLQAGEHSLQVSRSRGYSFAKRVICTLGELEPVAGAR